MNPTGAENITYGPETGKRTIDGNVTIQGDASGEINLSNLIITGDLIVDTSKATVNNYAEVKGTIDIQDVKVGTWNEYGLNNSLVVNDKTGIVLNVYSNTNSVTLNQTTTLTISENFTVGNLEVNSASSEINNQGTISELIANESVTVNGNAPATVSGDSNVVGDAITKAPEDGLKQIVIPTDLTSENAKFKVFNLMNDNGSAQKPALLSEVKTFIDDRYSVSFNTAALVFTEGKLSIEGSLLTTADWNKVKANGDKEVPYRISLLNAEGTLLAKIAMYQDGVAVIERAK